MNNFFVLGHPPPFFFFFFFFLGGGGGGALFKVILVLFTRECRSNEEYSKGSNFNHRIPVNFHGTSIDLCILIYTYKKNTEQSVPTLFTSNFSRVTFLSSLK